DHRPCAHALVIERGDAWASGRSGRLRTRGVMRIAECGLRIDCEVRSAECGVRSEFRNTDCGLIADWPIRANPQSTIRNRKSAILRTPHSAINPHSAIRNPH